LFSVYSPLMAAPSARGSCTTGMVVSGLLSGPLRGTEADYLARAEGVRFLSRVACPVQSPLKGRPIRCGTMTSPGSTWKHCCENDQLLCCQCHGAPPVFASRVDRVRFAAPDPHGNTKQRPHSLLGLYPGTGQVSACGHRAGR